MKRCSRCRREKERTEENFRRTPKGLMAYCIPCESEYRKERYQLKKQTINKQVRDREKELREYVDEYKAANPCKDCGRHFKPHQMDFDHLHSKTYNICVMVHRGFSIARIQEEMDKCELVCAICHRDRTHVRATG